MSSLSWLTSFTSRTKKSHERTTPIFFTNTLSGRKELFIPQRPGQALLYSCGPTVYGEQHLGNMRAMVFSDTIARVLLAGGYRVRRVINITDVGHLVGDGDEGDDKMAVGAKRERLSPEEIADRYTTIFLSDIQNLNLPTEEILFPHATDYIKEQIALAKTLEEKGFAYQLVDGLYFDTGKFPGYGKLGGVAESQQEAGARIAVVIGKHAPADFVLWRSAKPEDLQQWDSPWGRGNPGWHIECSAMSRALLGQEIDIHTGGEDHIAVHHNNEIAQSEAASGRTFVRYWMHNAFLNMAGEKISKSLGNVVCLSDVMKKGYHPLTVRYFFLQAHYRTPLSFSWDALAAASSALDRLWKLCVEIALESKRVSRPSEALDQFLVTIRDDLATPQALGILWETLKSEDYTEEQKWGLIEAADAHLGLSLISPPSRGSVDLRDVPSDVQELVARRSAARASHDFASADHLRAELEKAGYRVEDGPGGPVLSQTTH